MRVYGSMMALFSLVVPSVVVAQNMPVSTFLAKTEALKAKGMMAMFSSDVATLQAEMKAAAIAIGPARRANDHKAARPNPAKASLVRTNSLRHFKRCPSRNVQQRASAQHFRT